MSNITGAIGESYVQKHLKSNKYKILETNFHSRFGEIDIIAENGQYIVFVEVKTRDINSFYKPVEAVTYSKRQKIIKTAQTYLSYKRVTKQPRFDVASVVTKNQKPISIEYLENAF